MYRDTQTTLENKAINFIEISGSISEKIKYRYENQEIFRKLNRSSWFQHDLHLSVVLAKYVERHLFTKPLIYEIERFFVLR